MRIASLKSPCGRRASKDGSLYNALSGIISASVLLCSLRYEGRGGGGLGDLRNREFAQVPLSGNSKYLYKTVFPTNARQQVLQDTLDCPTMQGGYVLLNFIRSILHQVLKIRRSPTPFFSQVTCL